MDADRNNEIEDNVELQRLREELAHQTIARNGAIANCEILSGQVERLQSKVERYRVALQYIASPTMGRPADIDPEMFAREGATEAMARLALATCILIARRTLEDLERA